MAAASAAAPAAAPDSFCIGIYQYHVVPQMEKNGFPVWRAEGRGNEHLLWLFKREDQGFQSNYGPEFEGSTESFRTLSTPYLAGMHHWEQFLKKKRVWQGIGDWQTTVLSLHSNPASLASPTPAPPSPTNTIDGEPVRETRVVLVDDLKYSQWSISRNFSDGKPFDKLIEELNTWELDPLQEQFLCLDAFILDNNLHSYDNRRLYCLIEHQEKVRPWQVRVKVWEPDDLDKLPNENGQGDRYRRLVQRQLFKDGKKINTFWKR